MLELSSNAGPYPTREKLSLKNFGRRNTFFIPGNLAFSLIVDSSTNEREPLHLSSYVFAGLVTVNRLSNMSHFRNTIYFLGAMCFLGFFLFCFFYLFFA